MGWIATGQFSRAAKSSIPYYRRYVPLRLKAMIPYWLSDAVKRRVTVFGDTFDPALNEALAEDVDAALNKALAEAHEAFRARDWPEAARRWQALLDDFGDNEHAAVHAKLNISVACRLADVEAYKERIAEYVEARDALISRPERPS